jgi:murein DD-endopeptidase MepM/ murein hydrolase activator NlpD
VKPAALIAIGTAVAVPLVAMVAVPAAIVAGAMTGGEPKAGITPAGFSCGNPITIQQISANVPKVSGYTQAQVANAAAIIKVGQDKKMPPRAWVIAVATSMQESGLDNKASVSTRWKTVARISQAMPHQGAGSDHDSVGLFQQRADEGEAATRGEKAWGPTKDLMVPATAAGKFYDALKKVDGWQSLPLTRAAQRVQKSAYPNAYAKWENDASALVNRLSGNAANTAITATTVGACAKPDQVTSSGWVRPVSAPLGDGFHARGGEHMGIDLIANRGATIKAAAAGTVVHVECDRTERGYDCSHDGSSGDWPGGCGWYVDIKNPGDVITRYCHMLRRPLVQEGDKVAAGQPIGVVGSTGHSSGPHLHFEVHQCHGAPVNKCRGSAYATDPVAYMKQHGAPLGTSATGGEQAA